MTATEQKELLESIRARSRKCVAFVRHVADLAELCTDGPNPQDAGEHIVGMFDDLRSDLRALRRDVKAAEAAP